MFVFALHDVGDADVPAILHQPVNNDDAVPMVVKHVVPPDLVMWLDGADAGIGFDHPLRSVGLAHEVGQPSLGDAGRECDVAVGEHKFYRVNQ